MTNLARTKHAYLEIKDRLLDTIRQENLVVGDKLPTITEIADRYSVCRATAIRAVKALANDGVVSSRRRVGITVNALPPRKNVKHKSILTIVTRDWHLQQQISDAILECLPGWSIFQTHIGGSISNNYSEDFLDDFISKHQYEAYLLWSVNKEIKSYFQKRKLPCIVIGDLENGIDLPNITFDEYERYYQATRYLLQQGYPDIVFIQFERKRPGDYLHEAGVRAALSENLVRDGICKPLVLSLDSNNEKEGKKILQRFLSETQFPVGVVSSWDNMTCWLLQIAHEMGVDIPRQLGIITTGVTDLPVHTVPQVTSLRWDKTRSGFEIGKMLIRMARGYDLTPRHVLIPYEPPYVITRQTTKEVIDKGK